ncbi:BTAD domain-containing putative transcriptional regulator [Streptomyces parvulus]|uniref:BTAD domain-containing putative transcriptional regulator n=1 Tax=Streptomyces parvulus TaxID=146923 RepID=UPI00345635DC
MEPTPLHYRAPGYVLDLDTEAIDLCRFDEMVSRGQRHAAEGRLEESRERLDSALSLWQADPFLDLTSYEPLADESGRLQHLYTSAVTTRAEALLALGEAGSAVESLRREVTRSPSDERIVAALMTGLYRLGRQTEALRLYDRTRTQLSEELGVAPGDELRRVHLAILRHELKATSSTEQPIAVRIRPGEQRPSPNGTSNQAVSLAPPGSEYGGTSAARPTDLVPPLFDGRERSMALLRRSVTAALEGSGHFSVVIGHAGVGKTELLAQATTHAAQWTPGARVIRVSCHTIEGMPACWVWHRVLRVLTDADTSQCDGLTPMCSDLTPTARSDQQEDAPVEPRGTMHQHFLAVDALCETILRHADHTPLLLVIENIHCADRPTLDVLALLRDRTQGHALSIVISVREPGVGTGADLNGPLQHLLANSRTEVIHLDDLSEEQMQAFVTAQGGPDSAANVVRGLYKRSGGNPYLLGQLLAHAGGAHSLHEAHAARQILTDIPTGVSLMVRQRLTGLAPEVLQALRGCAVLGPTARLSSLTRMLGESDSTTRSVQEALRTGLVARDHDQHVVFRYGLVRDVVLDEMNDQERSDLHARALSVLDHRDDYRPEASAQLAQRARRADTTVGPDPDSSEQAVTESKCDLAQRRFCRS